MPNPIKYSTGSESNALKKGNLYIGTGDVGKGPSDVTGFYQGVSPSAGGYVIYMNKSGAPGGLSYHNAPTDAELISFTNNLAGESYTTVNECLVYYASQTDKVVLNRDYEGIVTDGLIFNLDAGFTPSYPQSGVTWYDISTSNTNGILTNGPTYTSSNGGGIVFDGVDDYAIISDASELIDTTTSGTVDFFYKLNSIPDSNFRDVWSIRNSSFGQIFSYENNEITSPSPIMRLVWRNSDNSLNAISSQIPYDNLLVYNITLTYVVSGGSTTVVLYKNGSLVQSTTVNKVLANPANEIRLGAGSSVSGFLNCTVFTYRLYNRVLTDTEITQNYNAQKDRFGL